MKNMRWQVFLPPFWHICFHLLPSMGLCMACMNSSCSSTIQCWSPLPQLHPTPWPSLDLHRGGETQDDIGEGTWTIISVLFTKFSREWAQNIMEAFLHHTLNLILQNSFLLLRQPQPSSSQATRSLVLFLFHSHPQSILLPSTITL